MAKTLSTLANKHGSFLVGRTDSRHGLQMTPPDRGLSISSDFLNLSFMRERPKNTSAATLEYISNLFLSERVWNADLHNQVHGLSFLRFD
jgi:hypothetical protein